MCAPMTTRSGKSIRTSSSSTGSWQRERTLGPGMPDVDRDRNAELFAGGVDRVVERVVEWVLLDQRGDPHQVDGAVGGPGPDRRALPSGLFRACRPSPPATAGPGGRPRSASVSSSTEDSVLVRTARSTPSRSISPTGPIRGQPPRTVAAEEALDGPEPGLAQEVLRRPPEMALTHRSMTIDVLPGLDGSRPDGRCPRRHVLAGTGTDRSWATLAIHTTAAALRDSERSPPGTGRAPANFGLAPTPGGTDRSG